ncbi:InlB_B-repeat-containing protein [Hexamita inflata]|uniref:InlB B-repeat-containing protein n=1 Tax=Hexamita inflata TaxID=28002 RepID=A0AA86RB47_9EUKA|nr:InlB B-repeat-containing protein [Hexamita inflata]
MKYKPQSARFALTYRPLDIFWEISRGSVSEQGWGSAFKVMQYQIKITFVISRQSNFQQFNHLRIINGQKVQKQEKCQGKCQLLKDPELVDFSFGLLTRLQVTYNKLSKYLIFTDDCKIQNVQGVQQMQQLIDLALSNNQIKDISIIGVMKQLERIYLSNNEISDISPLSSKTPMLLQLNSIQIILRRTIYWIRCICQSFSLRNRNSQDSQNFGV